MKQDKEVLRAAQSRVVEALARHTAHLHRAATAQSNNIKGAIDDLGNKLAALISERLEGLSPAELKAFAQGRYHTDRLKGLRKAIDRWGDELEAQLYQLTLPGFEELAGHEAEYARESLVRSLEDADLPAAPTAATTFAAAKSQPVMGQLLDDMIAEIPERTRRQVYSTIRQGIAEGRTTQEITRALRGTRRLNYKDGILQTTRNDAERMVRTGRAHISNVTYESTMEALGVEEMVWVATLEGRTCMECAGLDGKRFKVGQPHPATPRHYNCRCSLAPSFDGKIMGKRPYVRAMKVKGRDGESKYRSIGNMTAKQREAAGLDVGQVSANTTFSDWFANQGAAYQREWLGDKRYALYKKKSYSLDKFTDPMNREYTLEQLRQKDKEAFEELFG